MAWNPSPEVQVVRDAAAAIAKIKQSPVNRCVLLFTTVGQMGYVSYGADRGLCGEARRMGDVSYEAVRELWHLIDKSDTQPPRVVGESPDWDTLRAEVIQRLDLLRATFEQLPDSETRTLYMRDIGVPLVELLARFCMAFEMDGQKTT